MNKNWVLKKKKKKKKIWVLEDTGYGNSFVCLRNTNKIIQKFDPVPEI